MKFPVKRTHVSKPIFRTQAELKSFAPNLYEALRMSEKPDKEFRAWYEKVYEKHARENPKNPAPKK